MFGILFIQIVKTVLVLQTQYIIFFNLAVIDDFLYKCKVIVFFLQFVLYEITICVPLLSLQTHNCKCRSENFFACAFNDFDFQLVRYRSVFFIRGHRQLREFKLKNE